MSDIHEIEVFDHTRKALNGALQIITSTGIKQRAFAHGYSIVNSRHIYVSIGNSRLLISIALKLSLSLLIRSCQIAQDFFFS